MPVTMDQVAKQAGVSLKTVSRVVNGESNVSQETREKVLQVIKELGYVPNLAARRLSGGKAMAIGIILGWPFDSTYSSALVKHFFNACQINGYGFVLFSTEENVTNQVIQACLGKQVDGIIMDTISSMNTDLREKLERIDIPYIIVHPNQINGDSKVSYVTIDDHLSAKNAVKYLIELGHESIGCIFQKTLLSPERDRLLGYQDALREANIPIVNSLICDESIGGLTGGFTSAVELLNNNPNLSAIFCGTDELAMGAMNAIWQSGLKIPDDISIIGFDDISLASMVYPPLTTVHQPIDQIADTTVVQLIKMIEDPASQNINVILPTHLVVRETCKAITAVERNK